MNSEFICKVCGQNHQPNMGKWCDRSDLEIKRDFLRQEIKDLRNQRDWLLAILLGMVMALTFVIHIITMETPK